MPFGEPMLLRIASAYERATHHWMSPPEIGPLEEKKRGAKSASGMPSSLRRCRERGEKGIGMRRLIKACLNSAHCRFIHVLYSSLTLRLPLDDSCYLRRHSPAVALPVGKEFVAG